MVPISWEIETSPNGSTIVLQGTVEEIYAHLIDINPNYESDFGAVVHKENDANAWHSLNKRDDLLCNIFPLAGIGAIKTGIKYLKTVKGQPVNGPGPGNCDRVSCSYHSAIWWCNDVREPSLPNLISFSPRGKNDETNIAKISFL